jgi:N6-L-threonylcarbamoyladenine synthase
LKENAQFIEQNRVDLCASIQYSLVEMLLIKLKEAVKDSGVNEIAIAGGVSANSGLRNTLTDLAAEKGWNLHIPKFEYCTDNAAMIAMAAHYKYLKGEFSSLDVTPLAKMKL